MVSSAADPSSSISFGGVSEASGSASATSCCSGGAGGGVLGGSVGGPEGGPEGGPLGGPLGGLDGGPEGGPLGGLDGGPEGGPLGGLDGGPEGGPLGGAEGGPEGGPEGGFSGGVSDGEGASAGGCSRAPMSPNAPPSKLSSWDCSLSSRAFSADVFPFAMTAPVSPTWRGLNSGCAPEGLQLPAWCRGYHAGLSFLRPGFNSRSGRHTILLPSERVHRPVFVPLWRASDTTSAATPAASQGSSRVEFGTSTRTQ